MRTHVTAPGSSRLGAALRIVVAVAAVAALATGCEEMLRPGFPHNAHLTSTKCGNPGEPVCPTCSTCHQDMKVAAAPHIPTPKDCQACHAAGTPEAVAAVRHHSEKRTPIAFPHERHLPLPAIGGQCVSCHKGVPEDGVRGDMFPTMARCFECHGNGFETGTCTPCHRRAEMVRLEPETFLRHDAIFFRDHGQEATRYQKTCSQCHSEETCNACHDDSQTLALDVRRIDRLDGPQHHKGDFMVRHAFEAGNRAASCTRCHQTQFCDGCHMARGVSGGARGAINPHPIGWLGSDTASPTFHGRAARRDITLCAGCHDQGPATNCIRCHRVGGSGGNPHPGGWKSSRSSDDPMCGYCHGT